MNLIEQLGGYENCKKEHELAKKEGWRNAVLNIFSMALLEHRRAHNIFEIGDKVLFSGSPLIHEIRKFSRDSDDVYILGWGWTQIKNLKHATELEITAGHRL